MKRFILFLRSEIKLLLNHKVVLIVALLQPALMYSLMSIVFVEPTFDLYINPPQNQQEQLFLDAMQQVGIESGIPYINPIVVEENESNWIRQFINLETINGKLHVNQTFGHIDSNLIKNLRNRGTAAALIYWQDELGDQAIAIHEVPILPKDIVFIAYFGMALIPMGIFLGTGITSAILASYDFENGMILEMRMSPLPDGQHLLVQFLRIISIGMLSACINIFTVGIISGVWPSQIFSLVLPVGLLALAGGCLGMVSAFITRKALPAFLITLVISLLNWLLGDAFGLSSGFAGWYERLSYLAPNRYMVEILFPHYYHLEAGSLPLAWTILSCVAITACIGMLLFRRQYFKGEIK
ncbi:MAG: ABC transporter permease [Anaerolineaceae bacterium]|nr:ABC transporter permease [Anaerolineaceae bacterium]